jgi:hypothetical protein
LGQVLLQCICFEGKRIPFFLKDAEKRRNGSESGRSGPNDALRLDIDEIFGGKLLAVHWVLSVLGNISLDQALLKNTAYSGISWLSIA